MGNTQEITVPESKLEPLHPVFTDIKTQLRLQLDAMQNIQDYLKTLTNAVQDVIQYSHLQSKTPELLQEIEAFLKKHGTNASFEIKSAHKTQSHTPSTPIANRKARQTETQTANQTSPSSSPSSSPSPQTSNGDKETQVIEGTIEAATPKALLIKLLSGQDHWFPRSTIHNNYNDAMQDQKQAFEIDTWILNKNEVI